MFSKLYCTLRAQIIGKLKQGYENNDLSRLFRLLLLVSFRFLFSFFLLRYVEPAALTRRCLLAHALVLEGVLCGQSYRLHDTRR
jgi:hypothetical protein